MSDPIPPARDEITAILRRMGVKEVDESFMTRCVELNAVTQRMLATLPPPPDKGLEPAHVFAPPLGPSGSTK